MSKLGNPENPFAAAARKRQTEQETLKRNLEQDTIASTGLAEERGEDKEKRVKLTLALSAEDKVRLKTAAAKQGKTVAKLVHEWIATL